MAVEEPNVKTQSRGDVARISHPVTPRRLPRQDCYRIVDQRQSECAWVLFVSHVVTKETIVLKILKNYQDKTRYDLEERKDRHQCLIEALRVNRAFSSPFSKIYKGLVRIIYPTSDGLDAYLSHLNLNRDLIVVDAPMEYPTFDNLESKSEYALVMTQLPENGRLDSLLFDARSNPALLRHYRQLLVDKVVFMHKYQLLPLDPPQRGLMWGSLEQLKEKLEANLYFLQEAQDKYKKGLSRDYGTWLREQKELLPHLLETSYSPYFAERVQKNAVRHCHGDLKAPNIWIAPHYSKNSDEIRDQVFLLDAVDFNPAFANIDVLSDFAMLVIDVQVRMRSEKVAVSMVEDYLAATGQQDLGSRIVLNYYLIEKAIVGAAVSVIDEGLASFSRAYLQAAKMYIDCFVKQLDQVSHPQPVNHLQLASHPQQVRQLQTSSV